MRLTVTKLLNKRIGAPSVNALKGIPLEKGEEIDVVEQVKGDSYDGNNLWYKDAGNNFYWSGGVSYHPMAFLKEEKSISGAVGGSIDLINIIKLNGYIPIGKGDDIIAAILDSGVNEGTSLIGKIIKSESFITTESNVDDLDGHGTCVANIIAGKDHQFQGISPNTKLINYRVINNKGFVVSDALILALNSILDDNKPVDIINLSLDINSRLVPQVQKIIDKLISKGTIIVVSAGEDTIHNEIIALENVIKIGVLSKEKFYLIKNNSLLKDYSCVFINEQILINDNKYFDHDSAYAALVTGLVATFLSMNKTLPKDNNRIKMILNFIQSYSFSINQLYSSDIYKPMVP